MTTTRVEIAPWPVPPTHAEIPLLNSADDLDERGYEAKIGKPGDEPKALMRVAYTERELLIAVTVRDDVHVNAEHGPHIWRGDAVQFGIDALGDGARGCSADTARLFGADDLTFTLALGARGPEGWVHFAQDPVPSDGLSHELFSIERDESARRTHYRLALPWTWLAQPAFLAPTLGLAVMVNDMAPDGTTQERFYWGGGADGVPRPGRFIQLRKQDPVQAPLCAALWDPVASSRGPAVALVAGPDRDGRVGEIVTGGTSEAILGRGFARYRVAIMTETPQIGVAVRDPEGATRFTGIVRVAESALSELRGAIEAELANADLHPLFERHLKSVLALAEAEWAKMRLYEAARPEVARDTVTRLFALRRALDHDAGDWNAYLDGRRSLVMAFVSPHDGTLQHYKLCLPRDWQPDRRYPLFVELHGAGDPSPLNDVAAWAGVDPWLLDLDSYRVPKVHAEIARDGYWCAPFGRGNLGYQGVGEIDVWEACEDLESFAKIDPDRRYLSGFSMGGAGTAFIGLRSPDRWAAWAVLSTSFRQDPTVFALAENVRGVPVFLWCGESDFMYPFFDEERALFTEGQADLFAYTTPDVGHAYLPRIQREAYEFMLKHVRRRPNEFRFKLDRAPRYAIWGIRPHHDPTIGGMIEVQAKRDGQTLQLETSGTEIIDLDFSSPDGLSIAGDVTVTWNGLQAYQGPARPVTLRSRARAR